MRLATCDKGRAPYFVQGTGAREKNERGGEKRFTTFKRKKERDGESSTLCFDCSSNVSNLKR